MNLNIGKHKIQSSKYTIRHVGVTIILIALVLSMTIAGCKKSSTPDQNASQAPASAAPINTKVEQEKTTAAAIKEAPTDAVKKVSFRSFFKYFGLSKKSLESKLGPGTDLGKEGENGLEFPKEGIRVWFDPNGAHLMNQIFVYNKEIDFKGASIGDPIDAFKTALGKPDSENNVPANTPTTVTTFTHREKLKSNNAIIEYLVEVISETDSKNSVSVYIIKPMPKDDALKLLKSKVTLKADEKFVDTPKKIIDYGSDFYTFSKVVTKKDNTTDFGKDLSNVYIVNRLVREVFVPDLAADKNGKQIKKFDTPQKPPAETRTNAD